jgi:alpha-D-ribose 1-methylphosphonate 5-triphosphate diphosphatase
MDSGKEICLFGGRLFDGHRLIENGGVVFNSEKILRVFKGLPPSRATNKIDVMGRLILPGLVDLHSDTLEKCIEMRPGVFFDAEFALQNLDRRIVAAGITSFCHAISFADEELGLRSPKRSARLVQLIRQFDRSGMSMARHFVHARFELGSKHSAGLLETLMRINAIDMLSIMDHTPGQGQFNTLQSYLSFYKRSYGLEEEKVIALAERKQGLAKTKWQDLARLCEIAQEHAIPTLSHDDDTQGKIEMLTKIGVRASEFPITLAAAQAAAQKDMLIFMGAPNLIRDQSTSGHLKASEALMAGLCNGLVSDYYPECLLQGPFSAHGRYNKGLDRLLSMVTSTPAGFLFRSPSAGCLKEGELPDFTVVNASEKWVSIHQTWVNGQCVYHGRPSGRQLPEKYGVAFKPSPRVQSRSWVGAADAQNIPSTPAISRPFPS